MLEWADVTVPNFDERARLETRALFFLPTASPILSGNKINQASLVHEARGKGLGVSVIRDILNCEPVRYGSARHFIRIANSILSSKNIGTHLTTKDIVACVFRLKSIDQILPALELSTDKVAIACGLKHEIVKSAVEHRYRICLADALDIWRYLKDKKPRDQIIPSLENLTDNPATFIVTDQKYHIAVAKIEIKGDDPKSDSGEVKYVYQRDDLKFAPRNGHPWAVDAVSGSK